MFRVTGSFEYLIHMFWLRNKKTQFQSRTFICRPEYFQNSYVEKLCCYEPLFDGSNYLCGRFTTRSRGYKTLF